MAKPSQPPPTIPPGIKIPSRAWAAGLAALDGEWNNDEIQIFDDRKKRHVTLCLDSEIGSALHDIALREQRSVPDICSSVFKKKAPGSSLMEAVRVYIVHYFWEAAIKNGTFEIDFGLWPRFLSSKSGKKSQLLFDKTFSKNVEQSKYLSDIAKLMDVPPSIVESRSEQGHVIKHYGWKGSGNTSLDAYAYKARLVHVDIVDPEGLRYVISRFTSSESNESH